jgi:hypothetical protein
MVTLLNWVSDYHIFYSKPKSTAVATVLSRYKYNIFICGIMTSNFKVS